MIRKSRWRLDFGRLSWSAGTSGAHANASGCRNHVTEYWPNPGTKSSQIRSMYRRLKAFPEDAEERRVKAQDEAERSRREEAAKSAGVNGKVNGVSS